MRAKEGESNEKENGGDGNMYFLVYKEGLPKIWPKRSAD
jgi:hypothetical protein